MNKFVFFVLLAAIAANALTLEQVRSGLKEGFIASDSVEMGVKTTVSSSVMSSPQTVTVFLVRKGPTKFYSEIKMPLMNQRTIVNNNRMKTIDLSTRKSQVVPYNGESLKAMSYANFNPLDSGVWQEPVFVSEDLYSITGEKGTLYYDSKRKRIEKVVSEKGEKYVQTTFEYDATNNLKTMKIVVESAELKTTILTEILKLRHSRNFSDKLFEF